MIRVYRISTVHDCHSNLIINLSLLLWSDSRNLNQPCVFHFLLRVNFSFVLLLLGVRRDLVVCGVCVQNLGDCKGNKARL